MKGTFISNTIAGLQNVSEGRLLGVNSLHQVMTSKILRSMRSFHWAAVLSARLADSLSYRNPGIAHLLARWRKTGRWQLQQPLMQHL